MRIGIIEICGPNHYTAVAALAETYSIDSNNHIIIFTLAELAPLFIFPQKNISLQIKHPDQSIADFLNQFTSADFDRFHINTLSNYYSELAAADWRAGTWFSVHNIDFFFANKPLHRLRLLLLDWSRAIKAKAPMAFKDAFAIYIKDFSRQLSRNRFIKKLMRINYRIIVYSNSQKKYLEQYVKAEKIVVFPFCVHENIADTSANNTKLRICVPGSVSNRRRDYNSLLAIINEQLLFFKEKVTIDILGYIPHEERYLADEFMKLSKQGVDIIYNLDFVDNADYNNRLSKADIVLGNLQVQVNPYRRYGETKETGVIFNMIKAGKPALLPKEYGVDDTLCEICLFFDDYNDLYKHLTVLTNNKETLNLLKEKAKDIVKNYTPQKLYHLLAE